MAQDDDATRLCWNAKRERRAVLVALLIATLALVRADARPVALAFLMTCWLGGLLTLRYAWVDRGDAPSASTARSLVFLGLGAVLCLIPAVIQAARQLGREHALTLAVPGTLVSIAASTTLVRGLVSQRPGMTQGERRPWRFLAACAAAATLSLLLLRISQHTEALIDSAPLLGVPLLAWGAGRIPEALRTPGHRLVAMTAAGAAGAYATGIVALLYLQGGMGLHFVRSMATVVHLLVMGLSLMVLIAGALALVHPSDDDEGEVGDPLDADGAGPPT